MNKITAAVVGGLLVLTGCSSAVDEQVSESVAEPIEVCESGQEACADDLAPEIPAPPTFELSSLRESPEVCKLVEDSKYRPAGIAVPDFSAEKEIKGRYSSNATAFPFSPTTLPTFGQLHISVIPVDWEDSPGTSDDMEMYKAEIATLVEFWAMASEGNLEVVVDMPDQWFRIPGSVEDYRMTEEDEGQRYNERPKKQVLYDAIVSASDAEMDFSQTQIALPVWPTGKTVSEWGGPHEFNFDWNAALRTQEGTIYDIAGAGDWFLNHREYGGPWFYWAHEMGHMLGFVHLPDEQQVLEKQFDWTEMFWQQNGTNGFDVMGNQDGAIKTIGSWLRWVAGWLSDDQVVCVTEESIQDEYFELNHLNDVGGGVESLVIKISDTQVVVVESRRWDSRFDREIVHSRDGLVAYVVTSTKGGSQNSQMMLSPRDITKWVEVKHWRGSQELDANFCEGDATDVANIRIEAASLQDGKDYVHITRTDTFVDPSGPAAGSKTGSPNRIDNGCVFGPGSDN